MISVWMKDLYVVIVGVCVNIRANPIRLCSIKRENFYLTLIVLYVFIRWFPFFFSFSSSSFFGAYFSVYLCNIKHCRWPSFECSFYVAKMKNNMDAEVWALSTHITIWSVYRIKSTTDSKSFFLSLRSVYKIYEAWTLHFNCLDSSAVACTSKANSKKVFTSWNPKWTLY